jgi:hypothetical protein
VSSRRTISSSASSSSVYGCFSEVTALFRIFTKNFWGLPCRDLPTSCGACSGHLTRLRRAVGATRCHLLGSICVEGFGLRPAGGCLSHIEGGWKSVTWWGLRPGGVGGSVVVLSDLGGCLRRGELVRKVLLHGAPLCETDCFAMGDCVDGLHRRSGSSPCPPPARSAGTTLRSSTSQGADNVTGRSPRETSSEPQRKPIRSPPAAGASTGETKPQEGTTGPGRSPARNTSFTDPEDEPKIRGAQPPEKHHELRDGRRDAGEASAPQEQGTGRSPGQEQHSVNQHDKRTGHLTARRRRHQR